MASDYKSIAKEHQEYYGTGKKHLRFFCQLYSDKTHFVYELVQNADDNKSRHLELQLGKDELLVWNDGCQFTKRDVRSICSIGSSNKDLTQIGTFGIGFKAVYNYTDLPEIYSGDEHFRIRDLTKPEGIGVDGMAAELVAQGKTVFRLPFKKELGQEDIEHLKKRLCHLEKRALLFLDPLETVQWRDEQDGGFYSCRRCRYDEMQNVSQIELMANGDDQTSETFLVFRKDVQPPKDVIDILLQQAEDDDERQRIQRSAMKQQPVEVAFKLRDGQIAAMDSCVLFAYLPTEKETHLRFFIQARYQTTPARDNIPKIDNPQNKWNKWLVQETANFLPEVLERLKACGLLEPAFFDVLPLKDDTVPPEFNLIAKTLRKAMRDRSFVPTQNGGHAKAENVFYPHAEALRQLIKCSWLHPDSSWLHPEIRDTEGFRRHFKVMREAGVREVSASQMLHWLENRSLDWLKGRSDEWLRSLYGYLHRQKSELERIKKLPLVRLENGQHVCASDQLVFFLPDADEDRKKIKPFLNELPILRSALLEGDDRNDIEAFLKNLGVNVLRPEDLIRKWILPQYSQTDKPSVEQNRLHIRYLFQVWDKISETGRKNMREKIGEIPILYTYRGGRREARDFVAPCHAYLPEAYTGDGDLETYFSGCDDVWFVDDGYLDSEDDPKEWLKFLKEIGTMDTPRVLRKKLPVTDTILHERNMKKKYSTREATIEDSDIHGLEKVLAKISNHREADLSQVLWRLLVKTRPFWGKDGSFQGTYHRFYYKDYHDSFDFIFYRQLKKTPWLPDERGKFHPPAQCFAPTPENRRVLGNSVAYLHPDFDLSDEPMKRLAKKLTVHLNANTESVLNYLQTLSGSTTVSLKDVEPLYRFLAQQAPREEFKKEALIFTPNPKPRWWRTTEVFWENEGHLFGNDRGYLKAYYETLKPFFTALKVAEKASFLDYVRGIQQVTSGERADDEKIRKRIKILYGRIWQSLQEGGTWQWQEKWEWRQARSGKCWLGKKGSEWGFFFIDELVWNDHNYFARHFEGKVPFWGFSDDLLALANKNLGVEGCSRTKVIFYPSGEKEKVEDWSEKVQDLAVYIRAFLKSPTLCEDENKSVQFLDQVSVCLVEELKVTYKLKGISITDPNPPQSFLDTRGQEATLWLGLEADVVEYPELIGDALQDYFNVKELSGFVEDLLTKDRGKVIARWKQKGLQADICELPPEPDSGEGGETPTKTPAGTRPESENTLVKETGDGDAVLAEGETNRGNTGPNGGHGPDGGGEGAGRGSTGSNGGHRPMISGGHSGGHRHGGGGGEGAPHRKLKEGIAQNPSQIGEGLELVRTEYPFQSGDRVDILFKDSSGNPVTVEVETHIPSGNYVGVWQAVKYKHLAAVEYDLLCDQVRSVLVAPEIPNDVKKKCGQLGIEPKEVKM